MYKRCKLSHQSDIEVENDNIICNETCTTTENLKEINSINGSSNTYASVNADSCQAQVDNYTFSTSENTFDVFNTNKTETKKCVCTPNRTCKECKFEEKQRKKAIKQENIRETNKYIEELQQRLYQEALLILKQGSRVQNMKIIKAFRETEVLVEKSALDFANRYCQNHNIEDNQPYIYIYKMLLLPEGALKQFVLAEDKQILKQEYKKYAKHIHPDKNDHPHASKAFQKLNKYWQELPNQLKH